MALWAALHVALIALQTIWVWVPVHRHLLISSPTLLPANSLYSHVTIQAKMAKINFKTHFTFLFCQPIRWGLRNSWSVFKFVCHNASDVQPTVCGHDVWCIVAHKLKAQEFRSCHLVGWKMLWCQTPLWKKQAVVFTTVTMSTYQDLNAGFLKLCEVYKVCGIDSLKYIQVFYTPFCYWRDIGVISSIFKPLNMKRNKTNFDWLLYMSVRRPLGHSLASESPDLLPSAWRSGYARVGRRQHALIHQNKQCFFTLAQLCSMCFCMILYDTWVKPVENHCFRQWKRLFTIVWSQ